MVQLASQLSQSLWAYLILQISLNCTNRPESVSWVKLNLTSCSCTVYNCSRRIWRGNARKPCSVEHRLPVRDCPSGRHSEDCQECQDCQEFSGSCHINILWNVWCIVVHFTVWRETVKVGSTFGAAHANAVGNSGLGTIQGNMSSHSPGAKSLGYWH